MVWNRSTGAPRRKSAPFSLVVRKSKIDEDVDNIVRQAQEETPEYQPSPSTQRVRNLNGSDSSRRSHFKDEYAERSYEALNDTLSSTSLNDARSEQDLHVPRRKSGGNSWGSQQSFNDVDKQGHSKSVTDLFKSPLATRINYGSNLTMINDEISPSFKPKTTTDEEKCPTSSNTDAIKAKANFNSLDEVFTAFCQGTRRSQLSLFRPSENHYMDGRTFQKFARDCDLIDERLNATSVDLVFAKNKSVGTTKMTVIQFYEAVKALAHIRWPNHSSSDAFGLIYTFITHSSGPKVKSNVKGMGGVADEATKRLSMVKPRYNPNAPLNRRRQSHY